MRSHGKHLLEAFKVAGPSTSAPSSAAPLAPSSANSAGAGGPFGAKPSGAPTAKPSAFAAAGAKAGPPRGALILNSAQVRLLGLVMLVLVVVAFLLGRMSVSDVAYAEGVGADDSTVESTPEPAPTPTIAAAAAPASATPTASAPPAVDPNPRTPAEQALLDKDNVYTIKLIHYSNTEVNQRLAADVARYVIQSHNMPAVVAADSTGLYILVGAAPRQVDLDDYLARIKKMAGPPPLSRAGEFHTAYIEKIDRVFRRDK